MSESSNDKPPVPPGASDEVVRSSGASGESYSPLLKNLLEETLKDAEREKEDLQARIRERDESAREEREADARRRREELQNRVQAEQKRRETLIREREQDGVEASPEPAPAAVQESSGSSAGVAGMVILLLVSAGLGYLVHRTMGERDGFKAERDALTAGVTALHGEASQLTPDVKGGSESALGALENIGVRLKSLKGGMDSAVSEGARVGRESAERAAEIEKLQAEVAVIKAALQASEEALVAKKPGSRPRKGPRKPGKATGAKKVKVGGGDIFGSDTR